MNKYTVARELLSQYSASYAGVECRHVDVWK